MKYQCLKPGKNQLKKILQKFRTKVEKISKISTKQVDQRTVEWCLGFGKNTLKRYPRKFFGSTWIVYILQKPTKNREFLKNYENDGKD